MTKKELKLLAWLREEKNGNVKKVREEGFIPAVLYGGGKENLNLKVKKIDFEKIFAQAGESTLVDLTIGNEAPMKVLVCDLQRDAVNERINHVDFYRVDMTKKITTDIPFKLIGEARAVKEAGGILIKNLDSVEVECLPGDLISFIEVDLSPLVKLDDSIKISDLKLPAGLTILSEPDEFIATVVQQIEEKEEEIVPVAAEGEKTGEEMGEEVPPVAAEGDSAKNKQQ